MTTDPRQKLSRWVSVKAIATMIVTARVIYCATKEVGPLKSLAVLAQEPRAKITVLSDQLVTRFSSEETMVHSVIATVIAYRIVTVKEPWFALRLMEMGKSPAASAWR